MMEGSVEEQTTSSDDSVPLTTPRSAVPSTLAWTLHNVLSTLFGVCAVLGYVHTNNKWDTYSKKDWACAFITFLPLISLMMLLAVDDIRKFLGRYMLALRFPTLPLSIFLTVLFIISGLFYEKFQVFQITIFFSYCVVSMQAAHLATKYKMEKRDSIYIHLLIFFVFGWALDFRWYGDLYTGAPALGYDWWAACVTVLGVVIWGIFSSTTDFEFSMWPIRLRELAVAFIGLVPFLAIIIPIGLLSGFLKWNPHADSFWNVPSYWIENFTTVAVTEELYFRAILLNLFHEVFPSKRKWIGVLLSSIAFGLWHTPRRTDIGEQAMYILLSFIAGCIYSAVYIFGGNNLLGSSITHSIVDTAWEYLLRG